MKYALHILWLASGLLLLSCASDNESIPNTGQKKDIEKNQNVQMNQGDSAQFNTSSANDEITITDGPVLLVYPNGNTRIEGLMKGGKRHGTWTAYYENGTEWSVNTYIEGLNEGLSITYYSNGKPRYVGEYNQGERVGQWKFYDEQGVETIRKFD